MNPENGYSVLQATIKGYWDEQTLVGTFHEVTVGIVSHFGLDTFEVIENNIDRLLEVPNIGKGRVAKIKESWEKQKDVKDIMGRQVRTAVFLQGHGVSSTYAAKIYKQYGKDSIEKVQNNPYCLADDIWGIGLIASEDLMLDEKATGSCLGKRTSSSGRAKLGNGSHLPATVLLYGGGRGQQAKTADRNADGQHLRQQRSHQ